MSDEILARYTFLPWLRQGIAANIKTVDNLDIGNSGVVERADVILKVRLNEMDINNTIKLIGPGDIIGINPRVIVRTEPRNWITDFEPNYLPFIEFYDEDFLWRYTPARANLDHRLRPWLFLVVLTEDEFKIDRTRYDPLPDIEITANLDDVFPDPRQTWAWAHVHVNQDITANESHSAGQAVNELDSLLKKNPDLAASRLLCPRKLKPKTGYHAFLVPAFETGRLVGLGKSTTGIDSLLPAWKNGSADEPNKFPIYYEWQFHTSVKGDFEYLVNLLQQRPIDKRVGIRDMDVQHPGFDVAGISEPPALGLEGALKSPDTESTKWPPEPSLPTPKFLEELQEKVNLHEEQQTTGVGDGDPVITPPLYGNWHAIAKRLNIGSNNWINKLNKDPRTRVAAGFGTLVVQKNQEEYMQSAWEQVSDVIEANQRLRQAQMAREASYCLFNKHLTKLGLDQVLSVTAPVQKKVLGSSKTIHQVAKESKLPLAALSPTFRKITRPRGVHMKKVAPKKAGQPVNIISQLNEGVITAADPKEVPEKQISVNGVARGLVPSWLPEWMGKLLKYVRWAFILLLIILVLLMAVIGAVAILSAFVLVVGALFVFSQRLKRKWDAAAHVSEENLTTQAVKDIPPQSNFRITEPGVAPATTDTPGVSTSTDSVEAARFRAALLDLHERLEVKLPQPQPKLPLDLNNARTKVIDAIDPIYAIPKRIISFVNLPKLKTRRPLDVIHPVMAHPDLPQSMYEPLRDISTELLCPNLNLIPANTISLLITNQEFIESYMVGLNHEMGRELLWREYPTDQRGSYFRQFWDVSSYVNRDESLTEEELTERLRDIKHIHTWSKHSELGDHNNRDAEGDKTQLVLAIRGDLLKRYPNTVIFAQKAKWQRNEYGKMDKFKHRVLDKSDDEKYVKHPLYGAEVEPDLHFLGFDLTAEEARGLNEDDPGWYFVIQERPGEPRFGLDTADEVAIQNAGEWNDLSWGHLVVSTEELQSLNCINLDKPVKVSVQGNIQWATNAADMAYILYQVPVMIAVHAKEMLPKKNE